MQLTRSSRGFTLAELLVAMVVMSVLGLALVQVLIGNAHFVSRQDAMMDARLTARAAMYSMIGELQDVTDGGLAAAAQDILRRVPPQNLEAEQSVLGAILLDNEAVNQALETLSGDDFYREAHRDIFRAMVELADRSQPVDAITLTDALRSKGALETIGGAAYIAELAACV